MYDGEKTEIALSYVVRNWEIVSSRYFKNNPSGFPSVSLLLNCHVSLFHESQVWNDNRDVLVEWEKWQQENPNNFYPPEELKERLNQARTELNALGLGG